ncbi:NAD-dependent deacylase [Arcticibacter sp. MXS-1]|uniref:SIR2 family NAD-dependent protein deacylase n=1 Tax=Arcticibacter sp. MXS-1 TaxID=3341726 RepID=UPI0035A99319
MKKKIVILTGAGISAESGLNTFRDADGLWEGYDVNDVATPEAWDRDPVLVQHFYNLRRKAVLEALPNAAHKALVALEARYEVTIITQNIDDLHERAGSSHIVHLHGIITRSQSSANPALTYPVEGWELKMGEKCELGSQLRPHVVWFGEPVPMIEEAARLAAQADIFMIIGTSLLVYPAAGLVNFVPRQARKILIDPKAPKVAGVSGIESVKMKAGEGVPQVVRELLL